jgi:hypothetical protein
MGVRKEGPTDLERAAKRVEKPPLTVSELSKKFRADLAEGMMKRMEAVNPDVVFKNIIADVQKQRESMMRELLGVTNRWDGGKVEFDNCNGRKGLIETKTMQQFQDLVDPVVKEEVTRAWRGVESDDKHPVRVAIRNHIKESLVGYEMRKRIEHAVDHMCKELIETEVEAVRKEMLEGDDAETTTAAGVD